MELQPKHQEIVLELDADTDVVNDTVKITATLVAMIGTDVTDRTLAQDIRDTLHRFIDTKWSLSNPARQRDQSGYERVTVQATCRVPETENYSLDERRQTASKPGLQIASAFADTSIPMTMIRDAQRKLRMSLIERAREEADEVGKITNDGWTVGKITFVESDDRYDKARPTMMASTYRSAPQIESAGADGIGNTQRLFMSATVTLTGPTL